MSNDRRYTYGSVHYFDERGSWWWIKDMSVKGWAYESDIGGPSVVFKMRYRRSHDNLSEPPKKLRREYECLIDWHLNDITEPVLNIVEMISDGDCAFDQPCAYGYRVEQHAVYCHNQSWLYAPRKCHRVTGIDHWTGEQSKWQHADCPGYKAAAPADSQDQDAASPAESPAESPHDHGVHQPTTAQESLPD